MSTNMRLGEFIRAEMEPILKDWEEFAHTIRHARNMGATALRDHARDMLLTIADDIDSKQSDSEQFDKSKGQGPGEVKQTSAEVHGGERQISGFSVMETISEFRALRASVVSHWTRSYPVVAGEQLEDLTRFHEAIDQAVAESLEQYSNVKEMETRLFGAVLLASPDPIYVLDLEGRFVYANQATADLYGLDTDSIIGESNLDPQFSFVPDFQQNVDRVAAEQCSFRGNFSHVFASGEGERFEYLLAPVLDEDQKTEATVCILRDITERALAEEKIWHNAHHDLLTGLPNRRLFLDRLEQEVKHARRANQPVALLFMDLDGFKAVNDSLGHEAGDRVLCDVAGRLAGCVRDVDTVARLGGDEFTVILTGVTLRQDVEFVAQAIIRVLALPFDVSTKHVSISASIGVSFFPQDATSPVDLLAAADQAMYKAKNYGSNQVWFYGADENRAARDTASISS